MVVVSKWCDGRVCIMNFMDYRFIPVLGKTGSGKSDILKSLSDFGNQVLSLEELAGVKGVCLAHTFSDTLISQQEFLNRLVACFNSFDKSRPIWVEWKGDDVTGLMVPADLSMVIRRYGGVFLDVDLDIRVDRLLTDYSDWHDHIDLIGRP